MAGTGLVEADYQKRSVTEWRTLVQAYSKRTGTRQEFCREHDVAESTLDWWRRRLNKTSGLVVSRAKGRPVAAVQAVSFIELPAVPGAARVPWDIELELGEGMVLRLRRGSC